MKKYLLILFLIFLSCSKEKIEPYSLSYDTVKIEEVSFTNEEYGLEKYVDFKGSKPLPKYLLDSDYKMKEQISYEEYKEDIIALFHILKSRYSLYQEFGGDKVFNDLKEKALKKFENEKIINTDEMVNFLLNDLFTEKIHDLNLKINKKTINIPIYRTYMYDKYIFDAESIDNINGDKDLSKYIVKTLDEDGKIKKTIKINEILNGSNKKVVLKYKNGNVEKLNLKLIKSENHSKFNEINIQKKYVYFKIVNFEENFIDDYISKIEFIKNKDLILDLRNSSGYNLNYIFPLIKLYYDIPFDWREYIVANSRFLYNKTFFETTENKKNIKSNKNKIYIIVNNESDTASEHILAILKLIDYKNVIVLGTNTKGSYTNKSFDTFYLKNSKLEIILGSTFYYKFNKYMGEGKGFYPDIWLDLNDINIIEKIIKFIKN